MGLFGWRLICRLGRGVPNFRLIMMRRRILLLLVMIMRLRSLLMGCRLMACWRSTWMKSRLILRLLLFFVWRRMFGGLLKFSFGHIRDRTAVCAPLWWCGRCCVSWLRLGAIGRRRLFLTILRSGRRLFWPWYFLRGSWLGYVRVLRRWVVRV